MCEIIFDQLTSLPNRNSFLNYLAHEFSISKKCTQNEFAVLLVDLDRFRSINDSMGYRIGDIFLTKVSEVISRCIQENDFIARFGGDEFVILVRNNNPLDSNLEKNQEIKTKAIKTAEAIQFQLQNAIKFSGHSIYTSASIGIVTSNESYQLPEEMIRDAEIALYDAKVNGKSRYILFSPSLHRKTISRKKIEHDLRATIYNPSRMENELEIVFQPIVSLDSGLINAFEALLRWHHPVHGLLMPDTFIPIAEETNLIHPLGLWVLNKACLQLSEWQKEGSERDDFHPISMNVNISQKQMANPTIVSSIKTIIESSNIVPSSLNLEITESHFDDGDELCLRFFAEMREVGINFNIDDFGRGYSSFNVLHEWPINTLKIDAIFSQLVEVDFKINEILKTIIIMAKNLGISVIAEGVETSGQLEKLLKMNCPLVQGFYFSRPLSRFDAAELLFNNRRLFIPG